MGNCLLLNTDARQREYRLIKAFNRNIVKVNDRSISLEERSKASQMVLTIIDRLPVTELIQRGQLFAARDQMRPIIL